MLAYDSCVEQCDFESSCEWLHLRDFANPLPGLRWS